MDGLLLDTERLAQETFLAACDEIGWQADVAGYQRTIGAAWDAAEAIFSDVYGPEFPYQRIKVRWSELYEDHVLHRPVDKKPGAVTLLERLAELSVPCALATSTGRRVAEVKLRHAGLQGYFVQLVCGGEAARGKPHPDPYLAASAAIQREPPSLLAFEDSNNGVRAAHAAGLRVFHVPDLVAPSPEVRALGHAVVDSLHEVLDYLA